MNDESRAVKLCKDCVFMRLYKESAYCARSYHEASVVEVDYVYGTVASTPGDPGDNYYHCKTERSPEYIVIENHCGPAAKFFEPAMPAADL